MSLSASERPDDRIDGRPVNVTTNPDPRLKNHLLLGVLRRPVVTAQPLSYEFGKSPRASGLLASMGRVGSAFDNAMTEWTVADNIADGAGLPAGVGFLP